VVGEAVEQGSGQSFRAEDLGPLLKRQVRSYQSRSPFVALAEHLEEQFGTGLG